MHTLQTIWRGLDWSYLLDIALSVLPALICITLHECAHGWAAYRLGDDTAKRAGRLTLNPIRHIDIFGLVMMLVAKVGWAKPVPVDMRYFKRPKRDMALTALAGPLSNFVMALCALALCALVGALAALTPATAVLLCFLCNVALLSVGLGLFNLIPISPLDGSKVLFALLPDRIYFKILRYERYVMIALILLVLLGVFQRPLSFLMLHVLDWMCGVTGFPIQGVLIFQDLSFLAGLFQLG